MTKFNFLNNIDSSRYFYLWAKNKESIVFKFTTISNGPTTLPIVPLSQSRSACNCIRDIWDRHKSHTHSWNHYLSFRLNSTHLSTSIQTTSTVGILSTFSHHSNSQSTSGHYCASLLSAFHQFYLSYPNFKLCLVKVSEKSPLS